MPLLYVLRHAEPQEYGSLDSPLSAQGLIQIDQVAEQIASTAHHAVQIYTSPVMRALHSAQRLHASLGVASRMHVDQHLLPDGDVDLLIERLQDADLDNALLVGHIPQLECLLNRLVDGYDSGLFRLGPGSLVSIAFDVCAAGCASEVAQFHPLTRHT